MSISIFVRSMDRDTLPRALDSIAAQGRDDVVVLVVAACGTPHRELPPCWGGFPYATCTVKGTWAGPKPVTLD